MAAQFAMALRRYLEVHNHYDEARRWLEDAISLLQKSLDLQRNLGDDLAIVSALDNLGTVAISYALAD